MSRTLESLKGLSEKSDILHDTIAETYFYKKSRKKKHSKALQKRLKYLPFVAIGLTSVAFLLITVSSVLNTRYLSYLKKKIENSPIVSLFDTGSVNKELVKKFDFRGYAKTKSRIVDKTAALNNSRKYKWGDLAIDFRFPVNLSDRDLAVSLKGKIGGEKISIVLRDSDNRSSRLNDIYLTSNWKTEIIALDSLKKDISLSRVSHLRVESSYVGDPPRETGGPSRDMTVYIKDIRVSKNGKEMEI